MYTLHDDFDFRSIQQMRKANKMTQAQLSSLLYISRSCLANYETGKRTPSAEMLHQITYVLAKEHIE